MEVLILSANETAKILKMDTNALCRKLNQGEIPAYREGKNWKIPVSTLKSTIEERAIREAEERRKAYEEKNRKG